MEDLLNDLAHKLTEYVDDCNTEFERDMSVNVDSEKEWLLAQSLLCFFDSGSEQTKAVALCVSKGFATAARTCLRALLEIYLDARLMLDYGDPYENAARFLTHSAFELKKALITSNSVISFDPIQERLDLYKRLFPIAFSEIERKVSSNKPIRHWSGLSYRDRLSNIRGATFEGLDSAYGILSWDTHSRMAVHNSDFQLRGDRLLVKSLDKDNLKTFDIITNCAGPIFHNLSNAVFYSPVVIEKSTGKHLKRP